jgi:hypothetical protein
MDGYNMPNVALPTVTQNETCTKHVNEIIKYFCISHDAVGCGDCMIIDHKFCKIDRIQDISTDYFDGTEHQNILRKVEQFVKDIDEIKRELQASEGNVRLAYAKAIKDVAAFKKEIIDYLDDAESEMLDLINERKKKTVMLIEHKKHAANCIDRNIREIQTRFQLQVNQANELFVGAKQIMAKLNAIDENLNRLKNDTTIDVYKFQRSSYMDNMVKSFVPLGDMFDKTEQKVGNNESEEDCLISSKTVTGHSSLDRKSISDMDAYFDCEINIKTQDDASDCFIENCALLCSNQIIVTDRDNKCVKLVDVVDIKVSKYNLRYCPFGVAVVNPNLVAVTFPEKRKIQFLTIITGHKIIESHMLNVHTGCQKIAIYEDKIVGITDKSVEIMSISGQLIKSVSQPNLMWLMDIAVVPSSQMFYVSNISMGHNTVFKYDFDGNLIATYQNKDLVYVRGLEVTRDGTVLVCNWDRYSSIHMITPDCKKIKELLKDNIHVSFPYCVTFCNETNKLFVGNSYYNLDKKNKNGLKVFQLR